MFPGCRRAVMAGITGAIRNAAMIKHGRRPAVGGMAIITLVTTGNMGRRLAGRDCTVMTGNTTPQYMCVVDTRYR